MFITGGSSRNITTNLFSKENEMDKQREEFERRFIVRSDHPFDFNKNSHTGEYTSPTTHFAFKGWQAAQAAMQPEIDRMKEQVHQYDKWLSGGIYWTNEEYDEQVRKPLADCQAKLKCYEDGLKNPTFWIDPDDLQMDNESGIIYVTKTSFDGCTVPLFTKPEGE
jgi:hypothetical protein